MGRTRQTEPELTERQREVLRLVTRGHTNTEIAEALGLSLAGAKWHVSELLVKFNVDSREELAERWDAENRVGPRISRWWAGLVTAIPFKPTVPLAAGLLAVAGAGIGATLGLALMNQTDSGKTDDAVVQAAAPTPSPPPTVVPTATLPAAPGAIWSAQEALANAETVASELAVQYAGILGASPSVAVMRLEFASWNPGISHFDSPDDDHYWDRSDGARNAWAFFWQQEPFAVSPGLGIQSARLEIEVLIEDGKETLASRLAIVDATTGVGPHWGASGFFSRAELASMDEARNAAAQAAPGVRFGWYNDVVDGAWLEAYRANAGYWCVVGKDAFGGGNGGWCSPEDDPRRAALSTNLSTTFSATGVMGDAVLWVDTIPEIVKLRALPGDGRVLELQTYAPPAESGISRRFAWINLGIVAVDYQVIGLDAAGAEIATANNSVPGPPPPHP